MHVAIKESINVKYHLIASDLRASLNRYAFMNTDVNKFIYIGKGLNNILACLSSVVRKMIAHQLKPHCAGLARSRFVLTEHISSVYAYLIFH